MELSVNKPDPDEELAALAHQARSGNAESFNTLVRRVQERVRRWAQGVTHDSDDADDVAQLVLLRLHAHIDQFEGRSRFTTWLYRITRNLAFNRVHRERRRETLLEQRSSELVDVAAESGAVDEVSSPRLAELVHLRLGSLPDRQRAVFELGDLGGLNSTEIGERLGITPSTARGLLMKARRKIRVQILASHPELLEEYTP